MLAWISRSADERNVPRATALAAIALPLVGLGLLVLIRVVHTPTFRVLMEEDGVVEWLQFACFLGSAILAALIARQRRASGHAWQAAIFGLAATALLFIAGEEIAWGQRLLSLQTPPWLEEINLQEELTVHNIGGVLLAFNLVLLVTSLYAMIAEPVNRRLRIAERWDVGGVLFIPPFFLISAFGVMAAFRILRLVSGSPSQYTVTKLIEWAELCYAAALIWFLWLAYRQLAARDDVAQESAGTPS